MKLTYVALMRWQPGDKEPVMLGCGADLSEYSFFQRGTIKEGMTFTAKTVIRKTQAGGRQSVKASGSLCHVVVRESHLSAAVFCDEEYPARAAMSVAMQTINEFQASGSTTWENSQGDIAEGQLLCEQALSKYKVCLCQNLSAAERSTSLCDKSLSACITYATHT